MKKTLLIAVSAVLLAAGGISIWFFTRKPAGSFELPFFNGVVSSRSNPSGDKVRSALTGELIDQATALLRPAAVMVENLGDSRTPMNGNARPQAGLNRADIVYETLAEGGITRYLAIFQSQTAERIMPVRSARPYYVNWAAEYRAAYFHIGGSDEGLALIAQLRSAGTIFDGGAYSGWYGRYAPWVAQGRATEHTAFTSTASIRTLLDSHSADKAADFSPFLFKDELAADKRPASYRALAINFSSLSASLYSVYWNFDQASNSYLRFLSGVPHIDQITGEQLKVKNIIVERIFNAGDLPSGHSRQDIRNIGSGTGYLLRDGAVFPITWSKGSAGDRTVYKTADGNPIVLDRGQTWIEAPTQNSDVTVPGA